MTSAPTAPSSCDLLVRRAYVLTMDPNDTMLARGAVAITDGAIVAVGESDELESRFTASETIDARGGIVHPGLVECHMHASYLLFRWTFPDTTSWPEYLRYHAEYWDHIDDDDEHAGTLLGCVEMVRNGTTCYLESGTILSTAAAAAATEAVGMRGILGDPFVLDTGVSLSAGRRKRITFDQKRALSVLGTELARNRDENALVRGHIALRGLGSASDDLLLAAKELADDNGVVLNQHQSFNEDDVEADIRLRGGATPLTHFQELGVLGENCTFSHVNITTGEERAAIVESGMSPVWCPTASMLLGLGATYRGAHAELYREGVNVALGSDSGNSSGSFDLFEQGYLSVLTARDKLRDMALTPMDALRMMTSNGARAVGLAARIGSLEVGKRADLVIHRTDLPELAPGLDPVRHLVFGARSKSVRNVLVDGRIVVRDGSVVGVDEEAVFANVRRASLGLLDRAGRSVEALPGDAL